VLELGLAQSPYPKARAESEGEDHKNPLCRFIRAGLWMSQRPGALADGNDRLPFRAAGSPGSFSVPVRMAVLREHDNQPIVSKLYRAAVTVAAGETRTDFTVVSEPLRVPFIQDQGALKQLGWQKWAKIRPSIQRQYW
jgi:hypothetical protein